METVNQFIKRKNKQYQSEKDKLVEMKDIGRKGRLYFIREAWTFMPQYNNNQKIFIIERLKKERKEGKLTRNKTFQKGQVEYRMGYYIIGRIGRANRKWIWGQFCPLIPKKDFDKLIRKAKKEKTIL